jgi:hypothetical protein
MNYYSILLGPHRRDVILFGAAAFSTRLTYERLLLLLEAYMGL